MTMMYVNLFCLFCILCNSARPPLQAMFGLVNSTALMDTGMMSSRMVMSAPLHEDSLYYSDATENGIFPEIGV